MNSTRNDGAGVPRPRGDEPINVDARLRAPIDDGGETLSGTGRRSRANVR